MRITVKLHLDEDTVEKLTNIADEDGISIDDLVKNFVTNTDRIRHILLNTILYGDERRIKCDNLRCKEKNEKFPYKDYEEI